jgi:hypothetical protein
MAWMACIMARKTRVSQKKTKVVWVKVNDDVPRGHGVEFHHKAVRNVVVAFAVGYGWMHEPGTPVTVEILSKPPPGVSAASWTRIVRETKSVVQGYFGSQKREPNFDNGTVAVWYNA